MSIERKSEMLFVISVVFLPILLTACGIAETPSSDQSLRDLDVSSFSFLQVGMSYNEITRQVGLPDRDIGSGVYLFQYDLVDGRKVVLQFVTKSYLRKVWIVNQSGEWELWMSGEGDIDCSGFRLYISKASWHTMPGSDLASTMGLESIDLQDPLFTIEAQDIETWDWSQQVITLTLEASNRLRDSLADSDGWVPLTTEKNIFVVTLNGERLYGGIFIDRGSAMWVNYPVIYPDWSAERVTFTLRPRHTLGDRYEDLDTAERELIERPELLEFLQQCGKLSE